MAAPLTSAPPSRRLRWLHGATPDPFASKIWFLLFSPGLCGSSLSEFFPVRSFFSRACFADSKNREGEGGSYLRVLAT